MGMAVLVVPMALFLYSTQAGSSAYESPFNQMVTFMHTHTQTQRTMYLFPQVALVPQVEPRPLHNEHDNVDCDGHKLVVGSQGLVLCEDTCHYSTDQDI